MKVELNDAIRVVEMVCDSEGIRPDDYVRILMELVYGGVYECMNCGESIYYDEEENVYYHITNRVDKLQCKHADNREYTYRQIAIPKPKENTKGKITINKEYYMTHDT